MLDYFDGAARHHHDDEELELFPRLLRCAAGLNAERAALLVVWLAREHRRSDFAWQVQRSLLERISRGEPAELCESEIDCFAAFYRGHIAAEEQELLPLAAAMVKRRGTAPTQRSLEDLGRTR